MPRDGGITVRIRSTIFLISFAALGLELALMRWLSLRFWHHFAFMVVSVALLGFGASGVLLLFMRRHVRRHFQAWLFLMSLLFAVTVPCGIFATRFVPLNLQFLPWNLGQEAWHVLLLELLLLVPFFFAGALVGVALMDAPQRLSGHYAANLAGSGTGALGVVLLMWVLDIPSLVRFLSAVGMLSVLPIVCWRRKWQMYVLAAGAGLFAVSMMLFPVAPTFSQYKTLPQILGMPRVEHIFSTHGPMGRIDVLKGPAIHYAPGLSLAYQQELPPHVLMIVDGDTVHPVYNARDLDDWRFTDFTTTALPYHVRTQNTVAVIGAGGGTRVGLARFHKAKSIVALEANPQIVTTMLGPLAGYGGDILKDPRVTVLNRDARAYLGRSRTVFDSIQLPAAGTLGGGGAGLYAAQESYLYTEESIGLMMDRLGETGILCLSAWAQTPPRGGIKLFEVARAVLAKRGLDPSQCLVMIRNWAMVTVAVTHHPWTSDETKAIRSFCKRRSMDVCYLPDIQPEEVNQYHVLEKPYYYNLASELLSGRHDAVADRYMFAIRGPTDNRPYFHHFFRWKALPALRKQLGVQTRGYLEVGYLMLLGALVQTIVLSLILLVFPLLPRVRGLRRTSGKAPVLMYFLLLGIGFMFLEMGFLQRLVLYLGHPVYSAAVAISGFMVFSGAGSQACQYWRGPASRTVKMAGGVVVALGLVYLAALDPWLTISQTAALPLRMVIALVTIAPLGFAMGHMFPLGLSAVSSRQAALVPWAWAVNGCASVLATISIPLYAMECGFFVVSLTALACYAGAAMVSGKFMGGYGNDSL
ncbi:MAG: hypothetical protein K9N51_11040 [Candidatus Pacebacteria bacterium]|nr:hypothetical protein [Candidatus Paceibacterota bacterium]